MKMFTKLSLKILFSSALFLSAIGVVQARTVELHDSSIILQNDQYNLPESIIIAPIFAPASEFKSADEEWYKGIFYYSIERLGFSDIPFHYIVSEIGDVYVGNSGGNEQKIPIVGRNNTILIGYLADRTDDQINPRAFAGMESLLLEIANKEGINLNNISVNFVNFIKNEEEKFVTIEVKESVGFWESSLKQVVDNIRPFYSPQPKSYSLEIVKVEMPTEGVNLTDSPVAKVEVKNTGENAIYQGGKTELLASFRGGSRSKFFVNNLWATPAEATIMEEGTILRPGESKIFSFRLGVPLYFGKQSETFSIKNGGGFIFPNSQFTVTMNVNRPSQRVIEITRTELGYLRVRSKPSASGQEIARLSAGQRFLVQEDLGNGWLSVKLDDGRIGWISRQYTRNV